MTTPTVPQNLDWVNARAACSLIHAFKQLEIDVEEDVKAANSVQRLSFEAEFKMIRNGAGNLFGVISGSSTKPAVRFLLTPNAINVSDGAGGHEFILGLTLNNEGRCNFLCDGKELEPWQVRRMALERIFFQS
jgi:hypothetical protein